METITHKDGNDETFLIRMFDVLEPAAYNELLKCLKTLPYIKGYTSSGAEVPRDQLWLHDENKYFCEQWIARYKRWNAHPYPPQISKIQQTVQQYINNIPGLKIPYLNSCLVNYYRDGYSCIHPHRDNKQSFGERPTIVGLSIGATRKLVLRHCTKDVKYELEMPDNSLFIMAGGSQINFLHGVPVDILCTDERWSLTFREHT